jgi:hypothetical protein
MTMRANFEPKDIAAFGPSDCLGILNQCSSVNRLGYGHLKQRFPAFT